MIEISFHIYYYSEKIEKSKAKSDKISKQDKKFDFYR